MPVKRTTIELDEELLEAAQAATGGTLRSAVEQGLKLLIAAHENGQEGRRQAVERHRLAASTAIDGDVLLSGEAWR